MQGPEGDASCNCLHHVSFIIAIISPCPAFDTTLCNIFSNFAPRQALLTPSKSLRTIFPTALASHIQNLPPAVGEQRIALQLSVLARTNPCAKTCQAPVVTDHLPRNHMQTQFPPSAYTSQCDYSPSWCWLQSTPKFPTLHVEKTSVLLQERQTLCHALIGSPPFFFFCSATLPSSLPSFPSVCPSSLPHSLPICFHVLSFCFFFTIFLFCVFS